MGTSLTGQFAIIGPQNALTIAPDAIVNTAFEYILAGAPIAFGPIT